MSDRCLLLEERGPRWEAASGSRCPRRHGGQRHSPDAAFPAVGEQLKNVEQRGWSVRLADALKAPVWDPLGDVRWPAGCQGDRHVGCGRSRGRARRQARCWPGADSPAVWAVRTAGREGAVGCDRPPAAPSERRDAKRSLRLGHAEASRARTRRCERGVPKIVALARSQTTPATTAPARC